MISNEIPRWADQPRPSTAEEWIARGRAVARVLAADAVERDRAGAPPTAEVRLLKESGLVTLLGPAEHGGAEQHWTTACRVVREVAAGDGSIGQLLGHHYVWAWAMRLVGTPEQIAEVDELYTRNEHFFGGVVNPRDNDLIVSDEGEALVYRGKKFFSTGAKVSDLLVLEGTLEPGGRSVFAVVPSRQDGITFGDDWDNLGQRLTASGSVEITDVRVPWSAAAGYVDKRYRSSAFSTLHVPALHLVFANFYLGIAQAALRAGVAYTRRHTRAWPYGGEGKNSGAEEFYVLEGYGDLQSKLWAAETLTDAAGANLAQLLHADRESVTRENRGRAAVLVSAAKQRAIDAGLETANRVFELTGARATANSVGMDLHWRNLRTHSLHDPVAYKRVEVGRYALLGDLPTPSAYT
ncbi:acyl-CoA dehydrogenase family protein [Saccharopolyspora sp. S2-29]|uniref:Acyl-CoA dehydrogenase family protein n=1 Tax=Saccharopolyspora mangrovi TaxID=3082379 RepID=A0ABU6AIS0_9PSEU|nr:acyl-CoA dehydrogenase family protein [Saccharopolyspora sp. S2-29]MEB3371420.1 acyl-CoA dehydrogenase family protein [Saccharopolyspora sp. S2-29]